MTSVLGLSFWYSGCRDEYRTTTGGIMLEREFFSSTEQAERYALVLSECGATVTRLYTVGDYYVVEFTS